LVHACQPCQPERQNLLHKIDLISEDSNGFLQLFKNKGRCESTQQKGRTLYYIQPNGKLKLRECDLILHEKQSKIKSWRSFDKYAAARPEFGKWKWKAKIGNQQLVLCPSYWKNYICKHILGIAIRLNIFSVIPAAKNVPLGQKRKRGLPAKAKKVLLKQ